MSITTLDIYQDNKVGDSDLLPVHSPLVFLVDALYSGSPPDFIHCEIYNSSDILQGTFKCIPYRDVSTSIRRFMFIANTVLPGYMDDFEDIEQAEGTFIHVDNITKVFKLVFADPDGLASDAEVTVTAVHGSAQFGNTPNFPDVYNNVSETITGIVDQPCYVYFYNDSTSNVISLDFSSGARFVVSDSGGFVENVSIDVDGTEQFTDSFGETFFDLSNGTYNYTITKIGYTPQSGSFTISDNIVLKEITLVAAALASVTIHLDYLGTDLVGETVQIKKDGVLVDSGVTNGSGDYTTSLYEETYLIVISVDPFGANWEYEITSYFLPVVAPTTNSSPTVNLRPKAAVKFIVKTSGGTPIVGATIGGALYASTGNPIYTWLHQPIMTTNGSGEVTANEIYPAASTIGVRASGYSPVTQYVSFSGNIDVNIVMS